MRGLPSLPRSSRCRGGRDRIKRERHWRARPKRRCLCPEASLHDGAKSSCGPLTAGEPSMAFANSSAVWSASPRASLIDSLRYYGRRLPLGIRSIHTNAHIARIARKVMAIASNTPSKTSWVPLPAIIVVVAIVRLAPSNSILALILMPIRRSNSPAMSPLAKHPINKTIGGPFSPDAKTRRAGNSALAAPQTDAAKKSRGKNKFGALATSTSGLVRFLPLVASESLEALRCKSSSNRILPWAYSTKSPSSVPGFGTTGFSWPRRYV